VKHWAARAQLVSRESGASRAPFLRILDKRPRSWVRLASVLRWASDAENVSRLVNRFFYGQGCVRSKRCLDAFGPRPSARTRLFRRAARNPDLMLAVEFPSPLTEANLA
jgi:hypothetical protein